MDLKVFEYFDPEDEEFNKHYGPETYAILHVPDGPMDSEKFIINADSSERLVVYPYEIDRYIEILNWAKSIARTDEKEAIAAGLAEPVMDPRDLEDSPGVVEEEG